MKKDIHPEYKKARITCSCGNVLETHNTAGDLNVEICSACHPFFTGKQKLVDTAGRVDKFRAKMEKAEKIKGSKSPKKTEKSNSAKASLDKEKETAEKVKKLDKKTRLRKDASDGQVPEIEEKLQKETVDIQQESQEEKTQDSADK